MPLIGRSVVGVDVGSWSAKLAELRAGLRSVQLLRVLEHRFERNASPAEREDSLRGFLDEHGFSNEFIVAAYPANRVTQRHVRFPFVGAKRVQQALAFEIEEALPFPILDSVLVHEYVESGESQTDALAVLAPRADLAEYLASFGRTGVDPRVVDVEGASLGNLAGAWDGFEGARVVMDVGHSKTNVSLLLDGGPVMLRSIPVAGAHLTEAIAKHTRLAWDDAQDLKHASGLFDASGTQPVSPEITALLDRLVRETARSIQSIVRDPLAPTSPQGIVLVGGTSRTPGLAAYIEERVDLPCRLLGPPPLSSGLEELSSELAPSFAQATALALRGAPSKRVTRADFRKEEFRYTPDLSSLRGELRVTAGLFALMLVLWIASLASELAGADSREAFAREQLDRIYMQVSADATPADDPLAALEAKLKASRELAAHLGVTGRGLTVLEILHRIVPALPEDEGVFLSELRIESNSVRAQGVSGGYEALDRVREQLAGIDGFESVILSDVAKIPKAKAYRFSLTIQLGRADE